MSAPNLRIAAWFAGTVCTLGNSYENPVLDASTPDPGVLFDPRTRLYWAAVTSGDAAARFPLYTSTDLLSWKAAGHVFPDGKSPSWAKQDFWAPEPHLVNNGTGYAVYYAARNAAGILSVGVATSRDMNGTFVDIGHPLFDSFSDGQIDPTFFRDDDGKQYLVFKEDSNSIGKPTHIYSAELDAAGTALVSAPVALFHNNEAWEGGVTEAPWVIKAGSYYYIFYSGNVYSEPAYAIGVARAEQITGPYTKFGSPILHSPASAAPFFGPGHCSVVAAPSGDLTVVYAAWYKGQRVMLADRLRATADGWWTVGDPAGVPSTTEQPAP